MLTPIGFDFLLLRLYNQILFTIRLYPIPTKYTPPGRVMIQFGTLDGRFAPNELI